VKYLAAAVVLASAVLTPMCSNALPHNADAHAFLLFDNMYYRGKPSTASEGLIASNILYENKIWPNRQNYGHLPNRDAFEALVRASVVHPGPLVLDIEGLPLKGSAKIARQNMETLATLADWAHQAAPGKIIGYYGTNTLSKVPRANLELARELARHVDAFFPSMYTFNDDRKEWKRRAQDAIAEARRLDSRKPVYFYMWPQYHDGTPRAFQFVDASYWTFQLQTAKRLSDGIVLWSGSKDEWNDSTGWWSATAQFMNTLRQQGANPHP
jgi:hypothetical protein